MKLTSAQEPAAGVKVNAPLEWRLKVPLAGGLTFGGPPECGSRPYCLPGLAKVYGLRFGAVRPQPSRAATVRLLLISASEVA